MTMKARILSIVLLLCIVYATCALGADKAGPFILKERTCDDRLFTVYQNTSIDYRSTILILPADSLSGNQTQIRAKAKVIRSNGKSYEIAISGFPQVDDSTACEMYVKLKDWAAEPGDKLHITIHHNLDKPYLFERRMAIKKHGWGGDFSFPILSVQRSGDHPGGLGAGVSYTLKYVQAEKSPLNNAGCGLNFSFLDFDTDQKIEVGLGLVITFPDDLFQLGAGKNLTVDKDSGYYFLGINLPGLKEKLGL
jgi:hypothetical protein